MKSPDLRSEAHDTLLNVITSAPESFGDPRAPLSFCPANTFLLEKKHGKSGAKNIQHLFVYFRKNLLALGCCRRKKKADSCLLWIPTFGPQQAMGNMLVWPISGPPRRRQPPFSRARKVMGLFSFTIGCSLFSPGKLGFTVKKQCCKRQQKTLSWLEHIYIYQL